MGYARDLVREWNILFQIQQLHIAEGLRRSYNDSGLIYLLHIESHFMGNFTKIR